MSAFICSDHHISAIVRWAAENGVSYWHEASSRRVPIDGNEQEIVEMLRAENVESVNYRYLDEASPSPITYNPNAKSLRPVEVIRAVDCLEYQSCEHPGWKASKALALCTAVKDVAIMKLPGYEAADWHIGDVA